MPKIIAIHGPMAAGKSTITEKIREKLPDHAYVDRPFIKRGLKPLGSKLALKISKAASFDILRQIMKLGKNVIIQEVSDESLRRKLKHYLRKYNYTLSVFYIKCSLKEAKKRDKGRQKKTRPKLVEQVHKDFAEPSKHEIVIDTEKLSVRQSVNLILKMIQKSS